MRIRSQLWVLCSPKWERGQGWLAAGYLHALGDPLGRGR